MNLLAILLAILPHDAHIVRDGVDLLEINTLHDGDGKEYFQQLIGYDWHCDHHRIAGWRSMSGKVWRPPNVVWMDGQRLHVLRGKYWREFHSQYDPELIDRELLEPCHRRGIMGEKP